ncbi:MAG: FAD-dependent thymidylate synthase [bacterium]|nr:FAD-dependent thymidylate synthase [bacterium]
MSSPARTDPKSRSTFKAEPAPAQLEFWSGPKAELIDFDKQAEARVVQAFKFSTGNSLENTEISDKVWRALFEKLGPHDPMYREFESATASFVLEMSATCYAQFKRHRLMTQLVQAYDLQYAAVVPPAIEEMGQAEAFKKAVQESSLVSAKIAESIPLAGPYLLTNAHVKRVMCFVNAREIYHLSRLRCDQHAQWEIQVLAGKMLELIQQKWPNLLALAAGKDKFDEAYKEYFSA